MDDPNPPYKGVHEKGSVKIHEDDNLIIPIAKQIMIE